ncbi:MAG TPA: anion transporter [Vicinamibacterales bacterium]
MITFLIFFLTYVVVAVGSAPGLRVDRTGAAIIGAILMVVTGAISFDDAVRAVDFRTIVLLFGMMVLVAHLRLAGGFAALVRWISARVTSPVPLLVALVVTTGVLSALFVNDTICLVFTPIVLDIAETRRQRPIPYLLALASASNIGSLATMTGNPQNMLIGTVSGLSFGAFSRALSPIALTGLVLDALVIWLIFRRDLHVVPGEDEAPPPGIPPHGPLLVKSVVVAAGMLAAFLAGYDAALVAASGAAVLLVTRRVAPRKVYGSIDWDLLMLFAGLFVVVGAAERAGIDRRLFSLLAPLGLQTIAGLTATAAILGNAVSNVPAVMLFTRIVPQLPDPRRAWLVLAMASTLAGNLTILGSIANLIVVEGARRRGYSIGFWEYLRVGLPITVATMAFGVWWLSPS